MGKWVVDLMTHAQISTGDFMSRELTGVSTSQNVAVQNTGKSTINIKGLNTTFTNIYGTGTAFMYITFRFPTNDFYI